MVLRSITIIQGVAKWVWGATKIINNVENL